MYRLTHCLAGIKARPPPAVGDLATDRRFFVYSAVASNGRHTHSAGRVQSQFACCGRTTARELSFLSRSPLIGASLHPLFFPSFLSTSIPSLSLSSSPSPNSFGDRSFSAAGPRVWNARPPELRHDISFGLFRCKMKSHLFV